MKRVRVNNFAKSAYAGKRGTVVALSGGRREWSKGWKYARFVCLVFMDGHCAGRRMWFSIAELDLPNLSRLPQCP